MIRTLARALAVTLIAALVPAYPLPALAQSGPYTPQSVPDVVQQGSITYVNGAVAVNLNGQSSCTVSIVGTWSGTIVFQGTSDNVNWSNLQMTPYGGGSGSTSTSSNNLYVGACVGLTQFRVSSTLWNSGTAAITLHGANGSGASVGGQGGGGGGGSGAPLAGGSSAVATGGNQSVAIHAYNGATLDAVHSFTFASVPGWLASASVMYDPVSTKPFSVTAAGTNPTAAIGVQGITGGIALNTTPSWQYNTTPPTCTSGSLCVPQTDALGHPLIVGTGAGGAVPIINSAGTTLTIQGNGTGNGVTAVQSNGANFHIDCDAGCGAAPPWKYAVTTTTSVTVIKASPGTFAGIQNLASVAQPAGITCTWYDNASAASGQVLLSVGPLAASQVGTIGGGLGIQVVNGITMQCTGATPTTGIMTLYLYQPFTTVGMSSMNGWRSHSALDALVKAALQ